MDGGPYTGQAHGRGWRRPDSGWLRFAIRAVLAGAAGCEHPLRSLGRDYFIRTHHFVVLVFEDVAVPHVASGKPSKGTMMRVIIDGSARTVSFHPASPGSGAVTSPVYRNTF